MPPRLERRQTTGNFHFFTFSCHNRLPLLPNPEPPNPFLAVLEQTPKRPAEHGISSPPAQPSLQQA